MSFTPKDWRDRPDLTTPINALALEDLETRLAAYTDSVAGGGGSPFASLGWVSAKNAPFNAKGDGKQVADASISSTVNPTKLSSSTAAFTSADVGKLVLVNGAGVSGDPLSTTILSVTGGVATLAVAASTTVTGAIAFYGTDDTAAIQAAIDSLIGANSSVSGGTVYFPAGIYMCGGAYKAAATASLGSPPIPLIYRAQLALPAIASDSSDPVQIRLLGEVSPDRAPQSGFAPSGSVRLSKRSMLLSTRTDGGYDTTNGWTAFIGGPDIYKSQTQPAGSQNDGFTQVKLDLQRLDIRLPDNPTLIAVNAQMCQTLSTDEVLISGTGQVAYTWPTHYTGHGLICPAVDDYDQCYVDKTTIKNMFCAIVPGEHTSIGHLTVYSSAVTIGTQTQIYPWTADHITGSGQNYGLAQVDPLTGPQINGNRVYCDIRMWQVEDHPSPPAKVTVYHLWDGTGVIGRIQYMRKTGNWITNGSCAHVRWRNLAFDSSGATAGGGVIQEVQASIYPVYFRAAGSSAVGSISAGQTVEFFANTGIRKKVDLTNKGSVSLETNITTVAASTVLVLQYTTDLTGATGWTPIDGASGPSVSLAATGVVVATASLAAGAKGVVLIRLVITNNSAGALNPALGLTVAEFT